MIQPRFRTLIRTVLKVAADVVRLASLAACSHAHLAAENLSLGKQLALYVERQVKPQRPDGRISYEPDHVRKVDFAGVRGDTVVIMGEEIVDPIANTPNAGKTVRRRFTDIWKNVDGVWKVTIRQATVTSVQ
jgi:hypothetical protein